MMMMEESSDDAAGAQRQPRGGGEGEEDAGELVVDKEVIEEETIHDPEGLRGPSSDALIPPEDLVVAVGTEASSSGPVMMMEV